MPAMRTFTAEMKPRLYELSKEELVAHLLTLSQDYETLQANFDTLQMKYDQQSKDMTAMCIFSSNFTVVLKRGLHSFSPKLYTHSHRNFTLVLIKTLHSFSSKLYTRSHCHFTLLDHTYAKEKPWSSRQGGHQPTVLERIIGHPVHQSRRNNLRAKSMEKL